MVFFVILQCSQCGYRNHLWSCHGCSRGVCLFIHQCFVKWGKFSSVILVVERQNKEHEFIEKEDLFEHENASPETMDCFCV